MSETVRIGVIGAGRIGLLHARNLAYRVPGAALLAVADVDRQRAEECARQCRVEHVFEDPRKVIEHPEVDAVAICSPTNEHAEQIRMAAEAGKHVFCEKPIDLDLKVIDTALLAVQQAGVKLQVGFNRRFDPGFRRARTMVAGGQIGEPHLVRITSRDPEPPPPEYVAVSGGLFLDMTIHDLDMARWIVGQEVEEIHAFAGVLVDPAIGEAGDVDTAILSFRYTSGCLGAIDNSRRAVYGYDQRVEVFGSEGCVVVGNQTATTSVMWKREGLRSDPPRHFFVERYDQAYVLEMVEFCDAVLQGREPSVNGQDGRIPVLMAQAAQRSREEGRPVRVDLP